MGEELYAKLPAKLRGSGPGTGQDANYPHGPWCSGTPPFTWQVPQPAADQDHVARLHRVANELVDARLHGILPVEPITDAQIYTVAGPFSQEDRERIRGIVEARWQRLIRLHRELMRYSNG